MLLQDADDADVSCSCNVYSLKSCLFDKHMAAGSMKDDLSAVLEKSIMDRGISGGRLFLSSEIFFARNRCEMRLCHYLCIIYTHTEALLTGSPVSFCISVVSVLWNMLAQSQTLQRIQRKKQRFSGTIIQSGASDHVTGDTVFELWCAKQYKWNADSC